jgi:Matrixin
MGFKFPLSGASTTVYFLIYGQPSNSKFVNTTAADEIRHALRVWEPFTPLKFVELTAHQAGLTPPSYTPRIKFQFGSISGVEAGESVSSEDPNFVRTITFSDSLTWESVRELSVEFPSAATTARNHFSMFATTVLNHDVFSVALHEIGHALGLDHDGDVNSIMFKMEANDYRTIMTQTLPSKDAESIHALYGAIGSGTTPILATKSGRGYLIVGGEFMMAVQTSAEPWSFDQKCTWGKSSPYKAMISNGYCFNHQLQTPDKGYGQQMVYLLPVEEVQDDDLVVLGGRSYSKMGNAASLSKDSPSVASLNGWSPGNDWPAANLGNLDSREQIVGHYLSGPPGNSQGGYTMLSYILGYRSAVDSNNQKQFRGAAISGGWMYIGDANFKNQYQGRQWGLETSNTAWGPDKPVKTIATLGTCHSWPPEGGYKGVSYDGALCSINVFLAPG